MTRRVGSILFLGKEGDAHTEKALAFCRARVGQVAAYLGKWGDPLPASLSDWEGDCIISYLSRWVVPERLLKAARIAAINFHPASPAYPGIGCVNFALYENAAVYGVTCHHMAGRVDTGRIVATRSFPIFSHDSVSTLLARTYDEQLALFYETSELLLSGKPLPTSDARWMRRPFSRKEFDDLMRIRSDMSKDEIDRRVRATTFGSYRPWVDIQGYRFRLEDSDEGQRR